MASPQYTPALARFFLRYYPPALALEFEHGVEGHLAERQEFDLLGLAPQTCVEEVVSKIMAEALYPLSEGRRGQLMALVGRLVQKMSPPLPRPAAGPVPVPPKHAAWDPQADAVVGSISPNQPPLCLRTPVFTDIKRQREQQQPPPPQGWDLGDPAVSSSSSLSLSSSNDEGSVGGGRIYLKYDLVGSIKAHAGPLTMCAFNKAADCLLTASYDGTAKLWDAISGQPLLTLLGHAEAVYAIAWNSPHCNLVATGSFDGTACIWHAGLSLPRCWLRGHQAEVVCLAFNPQGTRLATGSMDATVRVWDVGTGRCLQTLAGHKGEVVALQFDASGERLLTGSFDATAKLWDTRARAAAAGAGAAACARTFCGHSGELSAAALAYPGHTALTASVDGTGRVWDVGSGRAVHALWGHEDALLDACFSSTGARLATASIDGTARVYSTATGACQSILMGHDGPVAKVAFNPQGSCVLTAGGDGGARLWDAASGDCLQVLNGHHEGAVGCSFSYAGDKIVTAGGDSACRIWQY